jgi:uncharacterized coiled-coil protein SlyX
MTTEALARLEKLETHVAHLEHQIDQLNQVIVEQDKLLGHLKKQVQRQAQAMESMEMEGIKANNAKPPHH